MLIYVVWRWLAVKIIFGFVGDYLNILNQIINQFFSLRFAEFLTSVNKIMKIIIKLKGKRRGSIKQSDELKKMNYFACLSICLSVFWPFKQRNWM